MHILPTIHLFTTSDTSGTALMHSGIHGAYEFRIFTHTPNISPLALSLITRIGRAVHNILNATTAHWTEKGHLLPSTIPTTRSIRAVHYAYISL